jgi:hypothetical protein
MQLTRIAQTCLLTLFGALAGHASADTLEGARTHIAEQAKALEPELLETRRDIHAHPELGNTEKRTSELVAKQLTAMGLEVKTGVARTGVVAVLKGALPGPTVALPTWMRFRSRKSRTCLSPRKPKAPTSVKKST